MSWSDDYRYASQQYSSRSFTPMKTVRLSLLITFCILAAFVCGIYFQKSLASREDKMINIAPRVYLEQLKTKINIRREGSVEIYLNGSKMEDDRVLDLKK